MNESALTVQFEICGHAVACGWLQDKFGMSRRIVPSRSGQWFESGIPQQVRRLFAALWQMTTLDTAALRQAFDDQS